MLKRFPIAAGIGLLASALVACTAGPTNPASNTSSNGSTSSSLTQQGTMNPGGLNMTFSNNSGYSTQAFLTQAGAPAAATVSHIWLTFDKAQIHYDGAASASAPATESADTDASWITIPSASTSAPVDVMNLTDASFGNLSSLANGTYTQIRVAVTNAQVVLSDGSTQSLTIPSNEMKIIKPFTVKDGYHTTLHFDFNSANTVKLDGSTWRMNPTAVHCVATYTANATSSTTASASTSASASTTL